MLDIQAVDEHDVPQVAHGTPALLSLFALKAADGKWQVLARDENIDALGSSQGEMGGLHWVAPGKGKNGLLIEHGGTWSGETLNELTLYDVSNGKVRRLTKEPIPIHSDNGGGRTPGGDCWDTDGHWHVVEQDGAEFDDLVIDFESRKWTGSEEGEPGTPKARLTGKEPPPPVESRERASYHFDGKEFKLVEETNPTPPL